MHIIINFSNFLNHNPKIKHISQYKFPVMIIKIRGKLSTFEQRLAQVLTYMILGYGNKNG